MTVVVPGQRVHGKGRWGLEGLWLPWQHNELLYDWAPAAAQLFAKGDINYRLSVMYLEFENLADPDDDITPPEISRSGGKSYFDSLSLSATKDYLRVAMKYTATSNSDATKFSGDNVVLFGASTAGTVGVHGKTFGAAANSKLYGLALVASPDFGDDSLDLVFDRLYPAIQVAKPLSSQIDGQVEVQFD